MTLHVYDITEIPDQKFCMHLIASENFVYFIDTNHMTQTILMKIPPMYISNIFDTSLNDTEIPIKCVSLLWKRERFLDFLDKEACDYFKTLIPKDITINWIPSITTKENIDNFIVPIFDKCTCFDSEDNIIDVDICLQRGCLIESVIAIKGFKYMKMNDEVICEVDYELFQSKQCVLSKPVLEKYEISLF